MAMRHLSVVRKLLENRTRRLVSLSHLCKLPSIVNSLAVSSCSSLFNISCSSQLEHPPRTVDGDRRVTKSGAMIAPHQPVWQARDGRRPGDFFQCVSKMCGVKTSAVKRAQAVVIRWRWRKRMGYLVWRRGV